MAGEPFSMVNGPISLYKAPAGTAAPEISADTPPSPWVLIGDNGDKAYSDDGVTINPSESKEGQRTLGSTGVRKRFRTEEDFGIGVTLLDMTAEAFAVAMNDAPITEVAAGTGTGGYREISLLRGPDVRNFAILARGKSPYADDMNAQYWIPLADVEFTSEVTYGKGEAAGLEIEFMALEHDTHGFGKYMPQNAAPL